MRCVNLFWSIIVGYLRAIQLRPTGLVSANLALELFHAPLKLQNQLILLIQPLVYRSAQLLDQNRESLEAAQGLPTELGGAPFKPKVVHKPEELVGRLLDLPLEVLLVHFGFEGLTYALNQPTGSSDPRIG